MSLTMDVVLQQARPVLPVLVIDDISLALDLARALHAGGIRWTLGDGARAGVCVAATRDIRWRRPPH